MKLILEIDKKLDSFCKNILVISILLILLASILPIILRLLGISVYGLDSLARHLVFFSTFLGGVLAQGRSEHITIDFFPKILKQKLSKNTFKIYTIVILSVSFLILCWLFWAAFDFNRLSSDYEKIVFWGISSRYISALIPIGFGFLCLKTFIQIILKILSFKEND